MGYRYDSDTPPKPEDHLRKFTIRNGAVMRISFACYYLNGHSPAFHDHIGWPAPDRVDDSCQSVSNMKLHFPFRNKTIDMIPIHLLEEGYVHASVAYEDEEMAEHMTTRAWIDEDDDNIVRMSVHADFPTFHDKPLENRFTIFVANEDGTVIDSVCHGFVTVLPGAPYEDQ